MTPTYDRVDGADLDVDEVLSLYRASTLADRRPVDNTARFTAMVRNANLIIVARLGGDLAGIARSISDFAYATYLSDLAVDQRHQRHGIGRALIEHTRRAAPTASLILLAAPAAVDYYPHIGFRQHPSAWITDPVQP